jgi:MFS family permease
MGGSFVSDWIGPRYALVLGVSAQAIVGFIMAGLYNTLATPSHVAGFVVVYGIFLSLGELGAGDNIGLIASKTSATGIRGQYYAVAAAMGKIGAFAGTYAFKDIANAGGKVDQFQNCFYVSSGFCVLSVLLAAFFLPHIGQDSITLEDLRFREYLESHGWDVRQLGLLKGASVESVQAEEVAPVEKASEKAPMTEEMPQ